MGGDDFGGGLWILVAVNSVIFIAFAASRMTGSSNLTSGLSPASSIS